MKKHRINQQKDMLWKKKKKYRKLIEKNIDKRIYDSGSKILSICSRREMIYLVSIWPEEELNRKKEISKENIVKKKATIIVSEERNMASSKENI